MFKKIVLAAFVAISFAGFLASAFPATADDFDDLEGGCGFGWHRTAYGTCEMN